jgi:hypothetical protein
VTDRYFSLVGSFWSWLHKTSNYVDLLVLCKNSENQDLFYQQQKMSLGKWLELELELIQTQMAQKPMLRAEVGMRVRCANKASAE